MLLTEVLQCGEEGEEGEDEDGDGDKDGSVGWHGEEGGEDEEEGGEAAVPGGVAAEAAAWSGLLTSGAPRRLAAVNGVRVRNLQHLAAMVVGACGGRGGGRGRQEVGSEGEQGFLRLELQQGALATPEPAAAAAGVKSGAAAAAAGAETGAGAAAREDESGSSSASAGEQRGGGGGGPVLVLDAGRLAAQTRAVLRHHSIGAAMPAELRRWAVGGTVLWWAVEVV